MQDMASLGVRAPDVVTRVSEFIPEVGVRAQKEKAFQLLVCFPLPGCRSLVVGKRGNARRVWLDRPLASELRFVMCACALRSDCVDEAWSTRMSTAM